MAKTDLPILEQRRIEASIIKPIYEELKRELGEKDAKRILSSAIQRDAIDQGRAYAADQDGPSSLLGFHALSSQWSANGALEIRTHDASESNLSYDVTRCRYAEMYREMGLAEIGHILSCGRDSTFCTGYDARIKLDRSQTIMQGASHCDFRFSWHETQDES